MNMERVEKAKAIAATELAQYDLEVFTGRYEQSADTTGIEVRVFQKGNREIIESLKANEWRQRWRGLDTRRRRILYLIKYFEV